MSLANPMLSKLLEKWSQAPRSAFIYDGEKGIFAYSNGKGVPFRRQGRWTHRYLRAVDSAAAGILSAL
jgi:hypothetical protein